MVATPQKAPRPRSAHELSPAPEGGSKGRVRCKPATPSKVATPVKSPDPKKSKTVAPDVVLEVPDDSQGPAAGDEVGSVPKDGSMVEPSTGTCENGKQGESLLQFYTDTGLSCTIFLLGYVLAREILYVIMFYK